MKEYLSEIKQVLEEQNTKENGLSSEEAAGRLSKFGPNKLAEGKKESIIHKFLMELKDPTIIMTVSAADSPEYADVIPDITAAAISIIIIGSFNSIRNL